MFNKNDLAMNFNKLSKEVQDIIIKGAKDCDCDVDFYLLGLEDDFAEWRREVANEAQAEFNSQFDKNFEDFEEYVDVDFEDWFCGDKEALAKEQIKNAVNSAYYDMKYEEGNRELEYASRYW